MKGRRVWFVERWNSRTDRYEPYDWKRTRKEATLEITVLRELWDAGHYIYRVRCYVPREDGTK